MKYLDGYLNNCIHDTLLFIFGLVAVFPFNAIYVLSKADCSNKKKKTTLKFKFVCVYFDFKVELNFLKLNQVIQTEAHIMIPIDR